jgi:hypothetical protein
MRSMNIILSATFHDLPSERLWSISLSSLTREQ